jgi:hypothetical protein
MMVRRPINSAGKIQFSFGLSGRYEYAERKRFLPPSRDLAPISRKGRQVFLENRGSNGEAPFRTFGGRMKLWLCMSFFLRSLSSPKSAISAANDQSCEASMTGHKAAGWLVFPFDSLPQPVGSCANRNLAGGNCRL